MTDTNDTAWQVVASKQDVKRAGMLDVQIGRRLVLLIAQDDGVQAFQGLCPHQMARLSEGEIIGDVLQCPHHLAQFRLDTGDCTGGWQLPPLRRYAVRVDGDEILLPDPLTPLPL